MVDFTLSYPFILGLLFVLGMGYREDNEAEEGHGVRMNRTMRLPVGRGWAAVPLATAALLVLPYMTTLYAERAFAAIEDGREVLALKHLDRIISLGLYPDRAYDEKARLHARRYLENQDARDLAVAERENASALHINGEQLYYRKLQSDILWMSGRQAESIAVLEELTSAYRFNARWREELKRRRELAGQGPTTAPSRLASEP